MRPAGPAQGQAAPPFARGGEKAAARKPGRRGLARNRGLRSPRSAAARTEVGSAGARRGSALRRAARPRRGPPRGGPVPARPSVRGLGVTGPAPSETLPAARPPPRTHQDPLEERVLLGREAHGRHGSGSSRGSRHRPARSARLSARRRCRSQARFSLESSAPPPLGLGCRRVALS